MTWITQQLPGDHPPVNSGKIGLLLVNLGTPDAPDTAAVRKYLGEFLSDPRVIEIPQAIWQVVLRGIILNVRPRKSAEAYSKVWTKDGSPLSAITAEQAMRLGQRLGDQVHVEWAMRYGTPSIASKLDILMEAGCERILLAPLYPQYCGATTASVVDKANDWLREQRWQPVMRTLPPYHDDPVYIAMLAKNLAAQLDALDFVPQTLLLSFHGMPLRTLYKGDPYNCHCNKTARLLGAALNRPEIKLITSFQSRFGNAKWLEPATDEMIEKEARAGTKRLAIAAPGFSADCLETLEELAIQGWEQFEEEGGEKFAALSCLNASEEGMELLDHLMRRELAGWV